MKKRVIRYATSTGLAAMALALSSFGGCGTADSEGSGFCNPTSGGGSYVASTRDVDGDEWTMVLSPESYQIDCGTGGGSLVLPFSVVIENGKHVRAAGVALGWTTNLPQSAFDKDNSTYDTATDNCGVGKMELHFVCPASGSGSGGPLGQLWVRSGGLAESADIEVSFATSGG